MVNLLQNKDELLEWTVPVFKCNQKKRKGDMKNIVWNLSVESMVHSIQQEYEN